MRVHGRRGWRFGLGTPAARRLAGLLVVFVGVGACTQLPPPAPPGADPPVGALADPAVVSFTLIDAERDEPVAGFDPIPDGAVLDRARLGTAWSIRANTEPATVGSVEFRLDGARVRIENVVPYAIAGDDPGPDYHPLSPPLTLGSHTLKATPYPVSYARGTPGTALTLAFTVVEDAANRAPEAADDAYGVSQGATLTVAAPGVLGNDADPDGDPLRAELTSPPANGTVTLEPDGSFRYVPNAGFHGADAFTYTAHDGEAASAPAVVSLAVAPQGGSAVVSFTLIDTERDEPVAGFDPIPDGAVLDRARLGTAWSIRANTEPATVGSVEFRLDGARVRIENSPPYALAGDSRGDYHPPSPPLALGSHTLEATPFASRYAQGAAGGSSTLAFTVVEGAAANRPPVAADDAYEGAQGATLAVAAPGVLGNDSDPDGDPLRAELTSPPANGTVTLEPDGSFRYTPDAGFHGADAFGYRAHDGEAGSAAATVSLTVSPPPAAGCVPSPSRFAGAQISPLACSEVKIADPYALAWDADEGAVTDGDGVGTGFTMILPASNGDGYRPELLRVDRAAGTLLVETTAGLAYTHSNSLDNALGVGLDLPNKAFRVSATLRDPPAGSGRYEQAGLWFGVSEDDHVKLVLLSTGSGARLQALREQGGRQASSAVREVTLPLASLELHLEVDPAAGTIAASYSLDGGDEEPLVVFGSVDPAWFSTDAAGIDFTVGTRSYAGVFASHRNRAAALGPLVYAFDGFAVREAGAATPPPPPPPPPPESTAVDFRRWRFAGVRFPTALAWAPDGRLYVADVNGAIHAFELDHLGRTVRATEAIATLGSRTLLGLAVDPDSSADAVVLWAAHSSPSLGAGEANSGVISRLSGPGFAQREDVITGLPRAVANHATNNIEFGPDGRLYIAQGGNTGAGASNDGSSEFGPPPRPEQPLSAALLVADVNGAGFDGSCASEVDPDGAAMDASGVSATDVPCDVRVYASGLRNAYDFAWHSNGELYVTDNGLGVAGTFPDLAPDDLSWKPGDGCAGVIRGAAERDAHDPRARPDLLLRVEPGGYYGHPNPSRGECVFYAGNPTSGPDAEVPRSSGWSSPVYMDTGKYRVDVQPEPTWKRPMFAFGDKKSANGIVEYASEAFCGALRGDLLVTYYSQTDQVRRLQLSADGRRVLADTALIRTSGEGGAVNPLPITQDPLGRIYVGEFSGSSGGVMVLDPIGPGCWQTDGLASAPQELLDAGGAVLGERLYAVAGKTREGAQRGLHVYDPARDAWASGAPLPAAYPAVENPAVVAHGGLLYAFGGSTGPFSGAVDRAAVYDPAADAWTLLPSMPSARGGATAQAIGDEIFVVGGMDAAGASLATVEVFHVPSRSWRAPPAAMATPRDNAGSAVLDGELFVFGGRTRNAAPAPAREVLASVEAFDPPTGSWRPVAAMPTGRRAMNVVVVEGRALVLGGERTAAGGTFTANEAYDPATDAWEPLPAMPVGRHGAVAGRIGNAVFVAAGGVTGGSSFSADVDAFRYR